MAAYAALVSLMNDLELIPSHPTHSFYFDSKHITSLSQSVNFLIDFMETYDFHKCSQEAVEVLDGQIASAAHTAHDVIESHVVDQIHAGSTLLGGKATTRYSLDFVRREAKKFGSTLLRNLRFYFLQDVQKAIGNMEFVKREVMQFKAQWDLQADQPEYSVPASSEPLTFDRNFMVGFDDVAVRLLDVLTGESSSQRVIPIVGMGGIGKTTLAKYAYQHLLSQQRFDIRLWATISQKYSIDTIHRQLLFRETSSAPAESFSQLGEQLHKMLWGRRYLVVLDDMWSVEAWNDIKISLPDNGNGSCVIVTSRLLNLASHLSSSPFEINFLDKDRSWELFCGKVFGGNDCPVELEEIGKEIVKRCRGLPLSIVVIAGHLRRTSREIEYWEKVANFLNPISSLEEGEQCLEIINLSYKHLPVYLKPCFLYMGIYPEDGWIVASEVIKFWVAEGFIRPKKGISLEEVGENYLNDLIDSNLILVRERRWNGNVDSCLIHDVVREMCLKIAKREKFLSEVEDATQPIGTKRRIVIPKGLLPLRLPPLLRSLVSRRKLFLDKVLVDLRLLRLLSKVNITDATNFQQVNLRYLAFSCEKRSTSRERLPQPGSGVPPSRVLSGRSSISSPRERHDLLSLLENLSRSLRIPSSVYLMWNMRTLIMHNYDMEIDEPFKIWEMPQLRHLEFIRGCICDPIPGEESKQLQNLHTLLGVLNLRVTEEVCKRMPNIKILSVEYNKFPGGCSASSFYWPQNFSLFNTLESLDCSFTYDSRWRNLVQNLRFPSSLKELSLRHSHLYFKEVTTMIKSLSCLGSLELDSVQGLTWDLAEEEFSHLKVLRLSRCNDMIYWNASSSNFPVLEILHISELPMLKEIPSDIGEKPTLKRIVLIGSNTSAAASAMSIVAEQESLGNQNLELDVGFWGTDEFHVKSDLKQRTIVVVEYLEIMINKCSWLGRPTSNYRK